MTTDHGSHLDDEVAFRLLDAAPSPEDRERVRRGRADQVTPPPRPLLLVPGGIQPSAPAPPVRTAQPPGQPPQRAPRNPSRRARVASRRGRTVLGVGLSVAATASAAIASFTAFALILPWVGFDASTPEAVAAPTPDVAESRLVSGVATPADRVVASVLATDLPGFDGWSETRTRQVPSPSLSFGCDPKDGLAPAAAGSLSLVSGGGRGTESVTVTVRAYPAGGGSLALAGIASAATACTGAYTTAAPVAVGAESVGVSSARAATVSWRRGDALVTVASEASARPGSLSAVVPVIERLDAALADALAGVCVEEDTEGKPRATTAQVEAARSPYLDRAAYRGHFERVEVGPVTEGILLARERTFAPPVDPAEVDLTPLVPVSRPTRPDPAPTTGPTALPRLLDVPSPPQRPRKPVIAGTVPRQIGDPAGPGCGWAFTAQRPPLHDAAAAEVEYERVFARTQTKITARFEQWQQDRAHFFEQWLAYSEARSAYEAYRLQVARVAQAWSVIDSARDDYYSALARWEAARTAVREFRTARRQAESEYDAAIAACEAAEAQEEADREAAGQTDGEDQPKDGTRPPRPNPQPKPEETCPPQRPAILDQDPPPPAGPRPTPSPQAQLSLD